jgi:hypothetical protein
MNFFGFCLNLSFAYFLGVFADKTNDSGYVTIQREDQELKDAAGIYFQQQQQQQQQQPQVTNLVKKTKFVV